MTPRGVTPRSKDEERAAHGFLVKWCVAMAILAVVVGVCVQLYSSSPLYP